MSSIDMPSKRAALLSGLWYTLSSFLTKSLGFITIPLFTRIMTPDEFGSFSAYAAFQTIMIAVFGLESFLTLNRARFDFGELDLMKYQFSVLVLSLSLTTAAMVLFLLFPGYLTAVTGLEEQYLLMMFVYLLFNPAFSMFQMWQRVRYRYRLQTLLSFSLSILSAALSVAFVITWPDVLTGRIVGQYGSFVVAGLILFAYYAFKARSVRLAYWCYCLRLAIPLVIATIGTQGLLVGSRIVVQALGDSTGAAIIGLATTVASIATVLIASVSNAWSPWLMDCLHRDLYQQARSTFAVLFTFSGLLAVGVALLAPEIIMVLGGVSYTDSVKLVPIFMVSCVLALVTSQYVFIHTFHGHVFYCGLLTLGVAALNFVACWLMTPMYGYGAVGYVNVVAYGFLYLAHIGLLKYLGIRDFMPTKYIFVGTLLLVASVPLTAFLAELGTSTPRYVFFIFVLMSAIYLSLRFVKKIRKKS